MRVHATLTIKVVIDEAEGVHNVENQLKYCAAHLASNGMLSGDGEAIVDTWEYNVVAKEE